MPSNTDHKSDKERMEDLLRPRYKVIANMPVVPFNVGDIHDTDFVQLEFLGREHFVRIDIYPHLFRKLSWYEYRDVSEMPEYVRSKIRVNKVFKLSDISVWQYSLYEPATLEDYQTYINNKATNV